MIPSWRATPTARYLTAIGATLDPVPPRSALLVAAVRPRGALDVERKSPARRHRNGAVEHLAELIGLAVADEPRGREHAFGGLQVGGAALVSRAPNGGAAWFRRRGHPALRRRAAPWRAGEARQQRARARGADDESAHRIPPLVISEAGGQVRA